MRLSFKKLSMKIVEEYGTQSLFAEHMGMSERTLSLKLNDKRDFKTKEIIKACELLDIEGADVLDYFFCKVS